MCLCAITVNRMMNLSKLNELLLQISHWLSHHSEIQHTGTVKESCWLLSSSLYSSSSRKSAIAQHNKNQYRCPTCSQMCKVTYAIKVMKINVKIIRTKNTFIASHLFEDILFKYLSSCCWAESTLARVSSTFSSILIASSPCSCTYTRLHVMSWICCKIVVKLEICLPIWQFSLLCAICVDQWQVTIL